MPALPPTGQAHLALTALAYLAAGAAHLAETGWTPAGFQREIGPGGRAQVLAVLAWIVAVILWPVPALRRHGKKARAARQLAPRPAAEDTTFPPRPTVAPQAPLWARLERSDIARAAVQQRTTDALRRASDHLDHITEAFGADHPYTVEALEILAHTLVLAGGHRRRILGLYLEAADRQRRCELLADPDAVPALGDAARRILEPRTMAAAISSHTELPAGAGGHGRTGGVR